MVINLTQEEIAMLRKIEKKASEILELCSEITYMSYCSDSDRGPDMRWLEIAKVDLEKGLMGLVRSVGKSGALEFPEN